MGFLDILGKIVELGVKKANKFEAKHDEVSMKAEIMTDEQLKTEYKFIKTSYSINSYGFNIT